MSNPTLAQLANAPIIDTRERVEVRHPGHYSLVMHVETGKLYRHTISEDAMQDDATARAFAAEGLILLPGAHLPSRLLMPAFWMSPIWRAQVAPVVDGEAVRQMGLWLRDESKKAASSGLRLGLNMAFAQFILLCGPVED